MNSRDQIGCSCWVHGVLIPSVSSGELVRLEAVAKATGGLSTGDRDQAIFIHLVCKPARFEGLEGVDLPRLRQ